MSDRFKFRVWWKKENRYRIDTHIIPIGHLTDFANSDEYVIEQCTGLKDKNGSLIYEGDRIFDGDYFWQVKWDNYNAQWILSDPEGYETLTEPDAKYLEIIGNIHETKGGKDE